MKSGTSTVIESVNEIFSNKDKEKSAPSGAGFELFPSLFLLGA